MIPILYERDEKTFMSNGLGRLGDMISAVVTEERNGVYELDFSYPTNGRNYEKIIFGRYVGVIHDDSGDVQPFKIVSAERPIDGIVNFHAVHISYLLNGITGTAKNINSLSAAFSRFADIVSSTDLPFTFSYEQNSTGYFGAGDGIPRSIRQFLGGVEGSVLDTYGGEYEFNLWNVHLYRRRGQKRDFAIRYGVNLTEYNEEIDYTNTFTSAVPYWTDGSQIVTNGSKVSPNPALTPYDGIDRCVPLDLSDKFESKPTITQLNSMARSVMLSNKVNIPSNSIEVNFVRLDQLGEYPELRSLLQFKLCDSVDVIFPQYGTQAEFKIVKTEYDVLNERFLSMELGDLRTTLSEALGISEPTVQNAPMLYEDLKSNYLTSSVALTSSLASIPMASYVTVGDGLTLSSGGYVSVNFGGVVLASGFMRYSGLTSGDRVALKISVYRGGSHIDGDARPEFYESAGGTAAYISIPDTPIIVQSGDTIMLRAYNVTAARGNAYRGVLTVRRIK